MVSKTILIVAAHSDDEVLGCGGTIARHVNEGNTVHAVFMTNGVSSRLSSVPSDELRRINSMQTAKKILGIKSVKCLKYPDNRMDIIPFLEIVQSLEKEIEKIKPQIIYTHFAEDLNIDHKITHNAVITAARPSPDQSVKEIYGFEVLSSTEWSASRNYCFIPQVFNNISIYLEKKIEAINAYRHELRDKPHSRSIEHIEVLARHRGYTVGFDAAEAFIVYRMLL